MSFRDDFKRALELGKFQTTELTVCEPKKEVESLLEGNQLRVYNYCKAGHIPRGGEYGYVGATDEEMAEVFIDLDHNTVRWSRYALVKKGLLKDSGIRRNKLRGKPSGKVWVISDGAIPEKPTKTDIKKCLRCGEKHKKLLIKKLSFHFDSLSAIEYWAICPIKKEPVLLNSQLEQVG